MENDQHTLRNNYSLFNTDKGSRNEVEIRSSTVSRYQTINQVYNQKPVCIRFNNKLIYL